MTRESSLYSTPQLEPDLSPARSQMKLGGTWMALLTIILFFLPFFNGLLGGILGGATVAKPGRAFGTAIIPAIVVTIGLWILLDILEMPRVIFQDIPAMAAVLLSILGMFLGALIGGSIGERQQQMSQR